MSSPSLLSCRKSVESLCWSSVSDNYSTSCVHRQLQHSSSRPNMSSSWRWHYYWIQTILLYCILTQNWISAMILPDENEPLTEVQTAVGLEASLPCEFVDDNMDRDMSNVELIIWFKEGHERPIYSFDSRGKPLTQAVHWFSENVLRKKAYFQYDSKPPTLKIKGVEQDDAGLYRCRVDFHKSPTRYWRINLTVLVPPSQLTILYATGATVMESIVGPFNEGSNINMTCLSSGGIPPPRVSWWREHALVDDSFQVLPDGTVRNVLHLNKLSRSDLFAVYTCQASNGHVVPPLSKAVKLDMNLAPLYVRLQGLNHPLVAGVRTQVTCSSAGARPIPQIIWNKGGMMLRGATQTTSTDGNITISEMIFTPVPEDNGKQVICSVTADTLATGTTGVFLKDGRTLDVKHAPVVTLNLGSQLDPNNLMKGSDVYLECQVTANPPQKRVEWFHNDKQLHSSRGVIIANQTLVLQGITKSTHGQYLCRATNIQGTVTSNEVYLDVKYPPVCVSESIVIRAALKQTVNITCEVDSNPMVNLTYKWHFNNSLEKIEELPSSSGQRHGDPIKSTDSTKWKFIDDYDEESTTEFGHTESHSKLPYANSVTQQHFEKTRKHSQRHNKQIDTDRQRLQTPNNIYRYRVSTFQDFGTVSCIAYSPIGHSEPCHYHIVAAELPDSIRNCSAFNATANSIQISCIPGNDGGIPQYFHVNVYDELNQQFLYNTSYKYPEFTIKRLPSDSVFVIRVTSYNLQGFSSRTFRIRTKTLSAPLLRTASSTAVLVQLTPLLGALVGVVITLLLGAVCIVIFIKFRTKRRPRNSSEPVTTETDKGSAEPLSRNMGSHSSLEDKNPDVVPQENSEDEYHLEEKAFDRLNIESQRILYTPPRLNSTSPPPLSPTFAKQYGELQLTTNPSFALYNSPHHITAQQRPVYTAPPQLLSTRSPPNIYTRIPPRTYLPMYDKRTSPTSPYGTSPSPSPCSIPLLSSHQQQQQQQQSQHLLQTSSPLLSHQQMSHISPISSPISPLQSTTFHPLHSQHHPLQQPSSLLITSGGGILGNYDNKTS